MDGKPDSQTPEPADGSRAAYEGPRGGPPRSSPFTPASRWVAEQQVKVVCMAVAIGAPLLALWLLVRGTASLHEGVWAYSVDGAGTIHYGPVTPADARSSLFREVLLQAAQACFTRNPGGLSYPEVAKRLFVGESWRRLSEEVKAELPERKRRNLYDHPEVEGIDILDEGGTPRYRIRGFVVRSGAIEGLPYEPPAGEFHLIVELEPQQDALLEGRYPFVVARHRATVRWPEEEAVR
jgi:hypothetical protein